MKIRNTLCRSMAFLLLLSGTAAFAQEYSLSDAISGTNIPLTMKPTEIPDDFRAVKITVSGSGDSLGISSLMPSIMMGGGTGIGEPASMYLEMLPVSWTKGQMVSIIGQQYLVTYGIEIGPGTIKAMSNAKKLPTFNLRLKLIKSTDIGSIMPLQEWTKEKYLRAVAQVVVTTRVAIAVKQPGAISVPTVPVVTTEPAPTKPSIDPKPTINGNAETTTTNPTTAVKGVSVERPLSDAQLYDTALQNAKSVASAMLLYAQDYDQTFPYVQGSKGANFVIYPYVKNINVYKTLNPMRSGEFRFNMCLAGVSMSEITDPANTPVFYDPFAWPNDTYLVAFIDSHVKFVSADDWQILKKNLVLKLQRKGTPLPATYELPATTGKPTAPVPTGTTTKPGGGTGG